MYMPWVAGRMSPANQHIQHNWVAALFALEPLAHPKCLSTQLFEVDSRLENEKKKMQ